MDLVARLISKTGLVNDSSGHVTMSSEERAAGVLSSKTLNPFQLWRCWPALSYSCQQPEMINLLPERSTDKCGLATP